MEDSVATAEKPLRNLETSTLKNADTTHKSVAEQALNTLNQLTDQLSSGKVNYSDVQDCIYYYRRNGVSKEVIELVLQSKGVSGINLDLEKLPDSQIAGEYLKHLDLSWKDLMGKKILDIGANTAAFAKEAKKKGIEVTSVEISPGEGIPKNVPYLIADAANLPFTDESFDLVVSHGCIQEIDKRGSDTKGAIEEAKRVLKKGGEFRFGPEDSNERYAKYRSIEPSTKQKPSADNIVYYSLVKT